MAILDLVRNFISGDSAVITEDMVRERAYFLWELAGCPEGDGVEFWVRAELELFLE